VNRPARTALAGLLAASLSFVAARDAAAAERPARERRFFLGIETA
jgi:hypothetical protein